jgi:cytochrome c peroxidase
MGPNPCIESGLRRKGLLLSKSRQCRLISSGYSGIAAALLLLIGVQARAQTPAGQAAIAHVGAEVPEIQILLGQTPATIPQTISFLDPQGSIGTYFPGGPVTTAGNPFFDTALTTNGRSCFTCHIPQGGWTISPPQINTTYIQTAGKSPLFQPIDSANCPDTPGATAAAGSKFLAARSLLFNRGDFRIAVNGPNPIGLADNPATYTTFDGDGLPGFFTNSMAVPEWVLTVKKDPTGCENDPTYGLPNNLVSVYRRTMPSSNVAFLDPGGRGPSAFNIMWDAREPSLESQFTDATEFHGQVSASSTNPFPPSSSQQTEGANFQFGTFAGQVLDAVAGDLTGADGSGALGGPQNLYNLRTNPALFTLPPFGGGCFDTSTEGAVPGLCSGILNFAGAFGLYETFADATSKVQGQAARRQSIARGEVIFDTRSFVINDVAGLNDAVGIGNGTDKISGTCSTCHNNSGLGNDSFLDPKREGIMDNSNNTNNALPPSSDFPLFAFYCPSGSIPFFSNQVTSSNCQDLPGSPTTCDEFDTTDPGLGLADGECEDLGKIKVPVLRNLAARAPYFHGGNVATLTALVNFYNTRFSIGLSSQDKTDLVNFLNTL